jgi:asparagine synthase (glutamine-hydrolysing)
VSAIFAVYHLDGRPADERGLKAIDERLGAKGPDGGGVWQQGPVALGHRLLATTPQPAGSLPAISADGDLVLASDARIDNRRELRAELGLDGPAEEIADAALLLAAYRRWGVLTPEHLIGDFAFAIWDARERSLFCARDPMGIRPLYYFKSDRLLVVASRIKAVLAYPGVPRTLNEARVRHHLQWSFDDTTSTFFQDVSRIPAAHSLVAGPQPTHLTCYWSPDPMRELRLGSDGEYADAFREIFVEAVRCRALGALHVGSTLSGGLDSSSIACAAVRVVHEDQRPLPTFSAIFPSLPEAELRKIDERSYMDAVLKSGPFEPTYVHADRTSPLHEWPKVLQFVDEPCLAPNLYVHWGLYKGAAANGVRVLLDGIDGDTTVSHGVGHLTDLVRAGHWFGFWREARALVRRNPSAFDLRSVVWKCGVRPLVPSQLIRLRRALRSQAEPAQPDLVNERHSHYEALKSPLIPYTMELADAVSSAFGLEVRYPFFDRRLVEFCLAIPGDQKLRGGWTRSVMRRALEGILPPEVQWRATKAELSPSFERRLFEADRPVLEEVVFSRLGLLDGYVDPEAVRASYKRWSERSGQAPQEALTLYGVATLALWLDASGGDFRSPG